LTLCARFGLVPTTPEIIEGALALHAVRGTSFYDALVLQAAIASGRTGSGLAFCPLIAEEGGAKGKT
jgi:predicted nucleic acid-binding protein